MGELSPIPHEIEAARIYIDEIVAGKGLCPPLAATMKPFRDSERGTVDWNGLSKKVEIISYHGRLVNDDLSLTLANQYIRYLSYAFREPEEAPSTKVWILPDFSTNAAYDSFLVDTKERIRILLLSTKANRGLVQDVFEQEAPRHNIPVFRTALRQVHEAQIQGKITHAMDLMLETVVEKIFTGASIYGQPLSDSDLVGFPTDRGNVKRFKYLNFGTHYMWQAVNTFGSNMYMGEGSGKRNAFEQLSTSRALGADISAHEQRIRQIRSRRVT